MTGFRARSLLSAVTTAFTIVSSLGAGTVQEGTVAVTTFWPDPSNSELPGDAVRRTMFVFANGISVGTTDPNGGFLGLVAAGETRIEVVIPSIARGAVTVDVVGGGQVAVHVLLDDQGEVGEEAELVLEGPSRVSSLLTSRASPCASCDGEPRSGSLSWRACWSRGPRSTILVRS